MERRNPPARPASFDDLYAEHEERVLALLRVFGVALSQREEVAQEVWLAVYRSLPLFDPGSGPAIAWITGIARNAARDWKRNRRRHPELSQTTDQEPVAPHTADAEAEEARRREALWAYFERAIPSEEQREAYLMHVVQGMTIEEVARETGARPCTVKWRIRMARRKLKEELTDEERRRLAVILPVMSEDALVRALRESMKVPDGVSARVWERVKERIEAEGGSVHDPIGTPATAPSPTAPKGYTFTGPGLGSILGGVFLVGALTGAAVHSLLTRPEKITMTAIDAETRPAPLPTAKPLTEPVPMASAAPSASSPAFAARSLPETWLIDRARKAKPAEALAMAEQHARAFPGSARAVEREEIAIHALLQLGRGDEAEARAVKLIQRAPKMRPAMESLFGRPIF